MKVPIDNPLIRTNAQSGGETLQDPGTDKYGTTKDGYNRRLYDLSA